MSAVTPLIHIDDLSTDGPFKATQLWHSLISHLRSHVELGCHRRHFLRQYDDVFTGSNAVDVVFDYLKNKTKAVKREVRRENAIKVCQRMLDNQVFTSVSGKPNSSFQFKDSHSWLYRFTEDTKKEGPALKENMSFENDQSIRALQGTVITNPNGHNSRSSLEHVCANCRSDGAYLNCSREFPPSHFHSSRYASMWTPQVGNSLTLPHSSWSKLRRTLSFARSTKESIPPEGSITTATQGSRVVNSNRCSAVKSVQGISEECIKVSASHSSFGFKELVLSHLLVEVDIPFLESILEVPDDLPSMFSKTAGGVVIQNAHPLSEIQNIPTSEQQRISKIPLVKAATACINSFPLGITHLWSLQACKIHCYRTVVDHCKQVGATVFPEAYLPICTAVIRSAKGGRVHKALKILQLLVLLMPKQRKDHLRKLLTFLDIVVRDLYFNIDRKMSNLEVVLRDFSSVIFSHPLMSIECSSMFLEFLLSHVTDMFVLPYRLKRSIQEGVVFCQQISSDEYHCCCQLTTRKELRHLIATIVHDPLLPARKRKYLLKKIEQLYPDLYNSADSK